MLVVNSRPRTRLLRIVMAPPEYSTVTVVPVAMVKGLELDATVVLVDDFLHDGKAEARAFRFRRHVRFEGAVEHRVGKAGAAVAEQRHHVVEWTDHERGGSMPALEQPSLLLRSLRDFFGGRDPANRRQRTHRFARARSDHCPR